MGPRTRNVRGLFCAPGANLPSLPTRWHVTATSIPGILAPVGDRPYFAWDVNVTEAELRDRLRCSDADARAQWQGWIMAEARYLDVWRFLSLDEILRDWPHIRLHLGRKRAFWEFLLDGWRVQGLIPT